MTDIDALVAKTELTLTDFANVDTALPGLSRQQLEEIERLLLEAYFSGREAGFDEAQFSSATTAANYVIENVEMQVMAGYDYDEHSAAFDELERLKRDDRYLDELPALSSDDEILKECFYNFPVTQRRVLE